MINKNMKRTFLIILMLFIPLSMSAAGSNSKRIRTGGLRIVPGNIDGLNKTIESRDKSFEKERSGMEEVKSKIYGNQNKFRGAVQNLIMMEKMIGRNGPMVAVLAEDLNNFTKNTLKLEQEFSERNSFKKFFFGQKNESVNIFSDVLTQRKEKIAEIKELLSAVEASDEVSDVLKEQIFLIDAEQERLNDFFEKETKRKGILTWFLNIFK